MPVWISSKIEQEPVLVAECRGARRGTPGGTGRMPPSPWIGSIRIAAVSGPIAAFSAFRSPNGTWSNPSTFGPKPSRYFGLPAGGEGRQRPAVEGALEGDDAEALRRARWTKW